MMDQQYVDVDMVGLNTLHKCLWNLKFTNDKIKTSDLWLDDLFVPDFTYPLKPVSAKKVHSMASHVHSLERARSFMNYIGGLLDERIEALSSETNKVFSAFGRGLDSLPYEVLALILEQAADLRAEDPKCPLRLSHVSRRFRSIMLSLPKAWSSVSSDMHPEWIDAVLARSRSSTLQVHLKGVNDFSEGLHALTHTLPHAERWRSFSLNAAFRPDLDVVSGFADLRKRLSGLELPRLVHAEFCFDDNHPVPLESRVFELHVFTTWNAPNLRSLTMTNSIPFVFQSPNLTKFTMRFECMTTFAHRTMLPFIEFLVANPQLKELCFHFSCYFPAALHMPWLVHDGIETLSIQVEFAEFELVSQRSAILSILQSMHLPKLSTVNIDATFEGAKTPSSIWDDDDDVSVEDDGVEVDDILKDMIPPHARCPAIKTCSLRILGYELTHPKFSLHDILHAMPNLQHLRIDTNIDLEPSACQCCPVSQKPTLRTLELNNCEAVLVEWVEDFVRWLQRSAAWEQFSMLTVRACPELPKAGLLEFVPKSKLTWIREIMFEDEKVDDPLEGAFEDGPPLDETYREAPLYIFNDSCVGTRLTF